MFVLRASCSTKHEVSRHRYYTRWQELSPGSARDASMKKSFYELAVANPGAVEWYFSLKLEMAVHSTKELLTQQMQSSLVPGIATVKARIEAELRQRMGEDVELGGIEKSIGAERAK